MQIKRIQNYLKVPETNVWDTKTVEAVCKLQRKHKLPESGLPSKQLRELIKTLSKR